MNDHDSGAKDDVRMRGFAHRHTVEAALAWLDAQVRPPGAESRAAADGRRSRAGRRRRERRGRARIRPRHDGRLRRHRREHGRGDFVQPPALVVIGDSLPGHPFQGSVGAGQGVRIMTGAPLPPGCDAVLPAEWIDDAAGDPRRRQRPRRRVARQTCRQTRRGHRPGNHAVPGWPRAAPAGPRRAQFGGRRRGVACSAGRGSGWS